MGKTALVTGASRGIGRAIAAQLSRSGWQVAINYLEQRERAEDLAAQLSAQGGRVLVCGADVSERSQVAAMVEQVESQLGPIELLVNNAGISHQALFQDTEDDIWSRLLAVNLTGCRNTAIEVLPGMISRKSGCIINISSMWGLRGASCEVGYAATKAAVIGLTKSLALEVAPSNIRVNAVAPGCIETDMVRVLGEDTKQMLIEETPIGRLGTPEDIAHLVEFLASPQASFITGQVITADGGFVV